MAEETVPTAELFLDDRGSLLRVRWDDDRQQLAVSLWRGGTCIGTHHLDHVDTARLASVATQAWLDGLRRTLTDESSRI